MTCSLRPPRSIGSDAGWPEMDSSAPETSPPRPSKHWAPWTSTSRTSTRSSSTSTRLWPQPCATTSSRGTRRSARSTWARRCRGCTGRSAWGCPARRGGRTCRVEAELRSDGMLCVFVTPHEFLEHSTHPWVRQRGRAAFIPAAPCTPPPGWASCGPRTSGRPTRWPRRAARWRSAPSRHGAAGRRDLRVVRRRLPHRHRRRGR